MGKQFSKMVEARFGNQLIHYMFYNVEVLTKKKTNIFCRLSQNDDSQF